MVAILQELACKLRVSECVSEFRDNHSCIRAPPPSISFHSTFTLRFGHFRHWPRHNSPQDSQEAVGQLRDRERLPEPVSSAAYQCVAPAGSTHLLNLKLEFASERVND